MPGGQAGDFYDELQDEKFSKNCIEKNMYELRRGERFYFTNKCVQEFIFIKCDGAYGQITDKSNYEKEEIDFEKVGFVSCGEKVYVQRAASEDS